MVRTGGGGILAAAALVFFLATVHPGIQCRPQVALAEGEGEVEFDDPNLEYAIRDLFTANSWTLSTPALEAELARVEFVSLDASGLEIELLGGIEYCTSLTSLDLSENLIEDISPLAALTALEELNLGRNAIDDVTALGGLTALVSLDLGFGFNPLSDGGDNFNPMETGSNLITDIDPLDTLVNLEYLSLMGNDGLDSIEAIDGMDSLAQLWLASNPIADYTELTARIDTLQGLFILFGDVQDTDMPTINLLENLQILGILGAEDLTDISDLDDLNPGFGLILMGLPLLEDISVIENYTNLGMLMVQSTGVTEIPDLTGFTNLTSVSFGECALTDISGFAGATAIESLELQANSITDISALEFLTALQSLRLNDNDIADIEALADNTGLGGDDWIDLRGNPLDQDSLCDHVPTVQARLNNPSNLQFDGYCQATHKLLTTVVDGTGTIQPFVGSQVYPVNAELGLTAVPTSSTDAFSHWDSASPGSSAYLEVTMDEDQTHTAHFVEADYTLTIGIDGDGTTWPEDGTYGHLEGQTVYITATPESGSFFSHWSGGIGAADPEWSTLEVEMDQNRSVTAHFFVPDFTLTIHEPDGDGTTVPPPGVYGFYEDDVVIVRARPNPGAYFVEWEDDFTEAVPTATLTMDASKEITAVFETFAETPIVFEDPDLEAAIRTALSIPTGDIYPSDAGTLEFFASNDAGITDLGGLEYFTQLFDLNLGGNTLTGIAELSALTNLGRFRCWECGLADLSPLNHLPFLEWIEAPLNDLTDFDGLDTLPSLEQISAWENSINDISALANFPTLRFLNFHENAITDISPLGNLPLLEILHMLNNDVQSIGPPQDLANLRVLTLSGSEDLSDISALASLTALEELDLSRCNISDISALEELPNLTTLSIIQNDVTDLTPLVYNPGLDDGDLLFLSGNPLTPYAACVQTAQLEARGVEVIGAFCDTNPPVITLLGDALVNLTVGDSYTDAGATAWDDEEGTLTGEIDLDNPVNDAVVGVYFVRYNVSDSWENAAEEVVRTVRVLPEDALSCQLQEWEFTALLSNEGPEYFTYDNFSGLTVPIGGVRWWGMSVDSGLDGCARDPNDFEIIFYEDNNGVRGDVVYSEVFEDLAGTPTGEEVEGLSVVEYAVTLDGCAALHEGWISIRGVEDEDCLFVWLPSAYGDGRIRMEGLGVLLEDTGDAAFCLIDGPAIEECTVPTLTLTHDDENTEIDVVIDGLYFEDEGVYHIFPGSEVTLTASAVEPDMDFDGWFGDLAGEGTTQVFRIFQDMTVSASFSAQGHYVPGCTVPFEITITNMMEDPLTAVNFTLTLPPGWTYAGNDYAEFPGISGPTSVSCTGGTISFYWNTPPSQFASPGHLTFTMELNAPYEAEGEGEEGEPEGCGPCEGAGCAGAEGPQVITYHTSFRTTSGAMRSITRTRTLLQSETECAAEAGFLLRNEQDPAISPEARASQGGIAGIEIPLAGEDCAFHSSDYDPPDWHISLNELLRLIQLFNFPAYQCDETTEDGYARFDGEGEPDHGCGLHDADYDEDPEPSPWEFTLSELLRVIQFYNSGGLHADEGGEDGFAPGGVHFDNVLHTVTRISQAETVVDVTFTRTGLTDHSITQFTLYETIPHDWDFDTEEVPAEITWKDPGGSPDNGPPDEWNFDPETRTIMMRWENPSLIYSLPIRYSADTTAWRGLQCGTLSARFGVVTGDAECQIIFAGRELVHDLSIDITQGDVDDLPVSGTLNLNNIVWQEFGSLNSDGHTYTYQPRTYHGARLEPVDRILVGAGQTRPTLTDYLCALEEPVHDTEDPEYIVERDVMEPDKRPALMMFYTRLPITDPNLSVGTFDLTELTNWLSELEEEEGVRYIPQIGLNLKGRFWGCYQDETQRVSVNASGGAFTLTFHGITGETFTPQTTAPIAYNADDAAVKNALVALDAIGPDDVSVFRPTSFPSDTDPYWEITFQGAYAGRNIEPLEIDAGELDGAKGLVVITTPAETEPDPESCTPVVTRRIDVHGTDGTYTLTVKHLNRNSAATQAIAHNAAASVVQSRLQSRLTGLSAATATVELVASDPPRGYVVQISGARNAFGIVDIVPDDYNLTSGAGRGRVETTVGGGVLVLSLDVPLYQKRGTAEDPMPALIQNMYDGLKTLGRPFFLRPGFEMNGAWDNYCPEAYRYVFRSLVEGLRKHSDLEFAAVWHVAPHGDSAGVRNWEYYYPGNDVVDWIGISQFYDLPEFQKIPNDSTSCRRYAPNNENSTADQDLKRLADFAKACMKPIIIAESSPTVVGVDFCPAENCGGTLEVPCDGGGALGDLLEESAGESAWKYWHRPYFDWIAKTPQVKAFCYINEDWSAQTYASAFTKDARLGQNFNLRDQYKHMLANRIFQSNSEWNIRDRPLTAKRVVRDPRNGDPLMVLTQDGDLQLLRNSYDYAANDVEALPIDQNGIPINSLGQECNDYVAAFKLIGGSPPRLVALLDANTGNLHLANTDVEIDQSALQPDAGLNEYLVYGTGETLLASFGDDGTLRLRGKILFRVVGQPSAGEPNNLNQGFPLGGYDCCIGNGHGGFDPMEVNLRAAYDACTTCLSGYDWCQSGSCQYLASSTKGVKIHAPIFEIKDSGQRPILQVFPRGSVHVPFGDILIGGEPPEADEVIPVIECESEFAPLLLVSGEGETFRADLWLAEGVSAHLQPFDMGSTDACDLRINDGPHRVVVFTPGGQLKATGAVQSPAGFYGQPDTLPHTQGPERPTADGKGVI